VHRDGTVSIYSGKVEIGQGYPDCPSQIAADSLIALERIRMVPADTTVSPDEGVTQAASPSRIPVSHYAVPARRPRVAPRERPARSPCGPRLASADGAVQGAPEHELLECADDALLDREIDQTAH